MDQTYATNELQRLYQLIFETVQRNKANTINRFREFNKVFQQDDENIRRYEGLLNEMPDPNDASVEQIREMALQVRSGTLEANYGDKANEEINLGEIAGQAIAIYEENFAPRQAPAKQKLEEPDPAGADAAYFSEAAVSYQELLSDNERHIGGRVAVIDSNRERSKLEGEMYSWQFRDPAALHFTVVDEADNLFNLVTSGQLSIISINVK